MPIANCKRCRGLVDGTQRREEATDIEEEEEEEEAADSEEAVAERNAVSGAPAVATSPRSSLAEPPGFSPGRDGAGASFGALLNFLLFKSDMGCVSEQEQWPVPLLETAGALAVQLMQCCT